MSTVFISYRRENTAGEARALFNDLAARPGEDSVFMDVDSIALGRDFRSVLQETTASCDLMLVLIGRNWADAKEEGGRVRLENPADYVRLEIEAGLRRDIAVTPVLVQGAHMPAPEDLPAEIRNLAYRNGFELSHNRWESDVQEMVRRLDLDGSAAGHQVGQVGPQRLAPAPVEPRYVAGPTPIPQAEPQRGVLRRDASTNDRGRRACGGRYRYRDRCTVDQEAAVETVAAGRQLRVRECRRERDAQRAGNLHCRSIH